MPSVEPQYTAGLPSPPLRRRPKRRVALLLALLMTGLGQAYWGYWRRAVLWATLPLFVDLVFYFFTLRFQLRAVYGYALPITVCAWLVPRVAAFWEVRSLPERVSGRSGTGALVLFGFGVCAFAFAVTAFGAINVAATMTVRSSAMQPTLFEQERVMLDPVAYRSRPALRGELSLVDSPELGHIKRVIGLPGDRVERSDGALFINGWAVPRCEVGTYTRGDGQTRTLYLELLGDRAYLTLWDRSHDMAPHAWVAGPGEAVLLDDDRSNRDEFRASPAIDDRGVRFERLEGRPTFLFLGLDAAQDYDWSRYGSALDSPRLPRDLSRWDARFQKCLGGRLPRDRTEPPAHQP